jgi:hypothetical protein
MGWYIGGALVAAAGVGLFVYKRNQNKEYSEEGGEQESRKIYKTQIKSKSAFKKSKKEALVDQYFEVEDTV